MQIRQLLGEEKSGEGGQHEREDGRFAGKLTRTWRTCWVSSYTAKYSQQSIHSCLHRRHTLSFSVFFLARRATMAMAIAHLAYSLFFYNCCSPTTISALSMAIARFAYRPSLSRTLLCPQKLLLHAHDDRHLAHTLCDFLSLSTAATRPQHYCSVHLAHNSYCSIHGNCPPLLPCRQSPHLPPSSLLSVAPLLLLPPSPIH